MIREKYIHGLLYAVLSSATFGLIPLFSIPLLAGGMSSQTVLCYRFLFAALMMGVIVVMARRNLKLDFKRLCVVVFLSILYALTAILLIESYKSIPSGIATTIHFLYPLAVTLIMSWFFGEKSAISTYIAIVVSLVGVTLLAWGGHHGADFKQGVALAMGTVVTYALYIVGVMKSRASSIDPLTLTFYVLLIGAIMFFIYAIATSGIDPLHSFVQWRDLLLVALVCTVLSDYTLVLAIKHIGSTMTSILGSMEPMTAVVVGVVYFGERFDVASIVGVLLVIIAVVIVIVQGGRDSAEIENGDINKDEDGVS